MKPFKIGSNIKINKPFIKTYNSSESLKALAKTQYNISSNE